MTVTRRLRFLPALAVVGALLGAALVATPAQAAPPSTIASTEASVLGCSYDASYPYINSSGNAAGGAWSYGCANNWTFETRLQSSRWWGWHTDVYRRWIGSSSAYMEDGDCSGTHDYRVWLVANNGFTSFNIYRRANGLTCR